MPSPSKLIEVALGSMQYVLSYITYVPSRNSSQRGAAISISSARVNKKGSDKKYNLQGMEINSPQRGEVYIQDGKKYVVK